MKHNQICVSNLHNNKQLRTQQKSSQGCPIKKNRGGYTLDNVKNAFAEKKKSWHTLLNTYSDAQGQFSQKKSVVKDSIVGQVEEAADSIVGQAEKPGCMQCKIS